MFWAVRWLLLVSQLARACSLVKGLATGAMFLVVGCQVGTSLGHVTGREGAEVSVEDGNILIGTLTE